MSRAYLPGTLFVTIVVLSIAAIAETVTLPEELTFLRQSELVIPQVEPVFEIEGRITDDEKQAAAEVQRFVTFERAATGDNRTRVHVAHTGDQLYVGFEIRTPPGQALRTTASRRGDPALWGRDDAMEMRFAVGDRLYGFIGNAAGVRGEIRYDIGDMGWETEHWTYAGRRTDDGWAGEFLIDAAAFDLERFEPGDGWHVDVFNNFKSGRQSGWAYQGGRWNTNRDTWPLMIFGERNSIYQDEQQLGLIERHDVGMESWLVNRGDSSRDVAVWARLFRLKEPEEDFSYFEMIAGMFDQTSVDVLPGADEAERLQWMLERSLLPRMARGYGVDETRHVAPGEVERINLRRPKHPGVYLVMWRYADVETRQVISSGAFPFRSTPALTTEAEYHYLTTGEVELRTEVPEEASLAAVRYTVFDSQGQEVGRETIETVTPGQPLVSALSATDWPNGELTLRVEALTADGSMVAEHRRGLSRPNTPSWWQSDAGKQITVSHGWSPVTATENEARIWGRSYQWDDGPLPAAIHSQGKNLLASPVRLVTTLSDGRQVSWQRQQAELLEADDGQAVYRSTHRTDDLQLTTQTTVEFDGMARFDLELSSRQDVPTVEQMFLEIPVRRKHAQMFARSRYMGLVPGAEQPSEWAEQYPESGFVGDEPKAYPFVPWLTVRDDHVGLQWFAEQDWHWSNADDDRKIELVPYEDHVVMRVRLIDQSTQIDEPRPITFGLQAWPVRAWPEREQNVSNYLGNFNVPDESLFHGPMGGSAEAVGDHIAEAIEHGMDVMWIFHWSGQWGPGGSSVVSIPDYPQLHHVDYPQYHKDVLERVSTYAAVTADLGIPVIGHAGYAMPTYVPDFQVWGMELVRRPLEHKGVYGYKACANSPYTDAFVTRFKELAEATGWSGVQLDEALVPAYCNSVRHGCGWHGPDRKVRGSYPIFAFRDMARRIYNVFHGEVDLPGVEQGFVYNHSSSPIPSAIFGFSDKLHGGEERATMNAATLAQIDLDEQRAKYPVGAFGVPMDLLLKLGKAPVGPRGRIAWAVQTNMNLVHNRILQWLPRNDYRKSSIPLDRLWKAREWVDASPENFFGYWRNADYLTVSPDNFYAGFYLQPGERMLLAVSNWHPEPRQASVRLDLDALGFADRDVVAEDAVNDETVEIDGQHIALDVTEDGYRLIKIWAR